MANKIGIFDAELRTEAWFDPTQLAVGWYHYGMPFEHELIESPAAASTYVPYDLQHSPQHQTVMSM